MLLRSAVAIVLFLATASSLSTNGLFSDHMVLQTSANNPHTPPTTLFGDAAPGATVSLAFDPAFPGSPYRATAAADGSWNITLFPDSNASAAGYKLLLTEEGSGQQITASDVLFGEVFLCSGQSNMEKTVSYIYNASLEIAAADYPQMRLFQRSSAGTPNGPWPVPSREMNGSCIWADGKGTKSCTAPRRAWTLVTPTVIGSFSAICYLTARDLLRLGVSGPIGLIESDWGGTPVQAWTRPEGLSACGMPANDCPTEKGGDCKDYPGKLFNHMVYPMVGYGLRAVLWYQGEANSDEGFPLTRQQYGCVFAQMINEWRDAWRAPNLPFLYVQLSSWTGNWGFDNLTCVANFCPVVSRVRLAQADVVGQAGPLLDPLPHSPALPLPGTGMAVAYDQGDNQQHGVHSRFKSEPARRLALQVLRVAFNRDPLDGSDYSGPLPVSAQAEPSGLSVIVKLSHSQGLYLNDTQTCGEQFERRCCNAGSSAFGARICVSKDPLECAATPANNRSTFDANVTVAADGTSVRLTAESAKMQSGVKATFVDFGVTDFPQCSVNNKDHIALGPFGPLPVGLNVVGPDQWTRQ